MGRAGQMGFIDLPLPHGLSWCTCRYRGIIVRKGQGGGGGMVRWRQSFPAVETQDIDMVQQSQSHLCTPLCMPSPDCSNVGA